MFVPRYWSEASQVEEVPPRRVTLRRFGWSSTSQEDADVHARRRVEEAAAVLRAGGDAALRTFTRRERKVAYAGSDGLPIREEIVEERPDLDVVLTRNGYGALCLNTTRAMFVDVDRPSSRAVAFGCFGALTGLVAGGLLAPLFVDVPRAVKIAVVILGALLGALVLGWIATKIGRLVEGFSARARDPVRWSIERCRAWCESRPTWRVAVYETPSGLRLLPLHAPFDAAETSSFEFMRFVGVDPLYERMCRLQKCFRARVSPKPWRAGIADRFPAGGTWPVTDPGKLAARAEWVERYEEEAREFASCRFLEVVGDGPTALAVDDVRRLHDDLCRVASGLPLA
jgi:hypothetical protein